MANLPLDMQLSKPLPNFYLRLDRQASISLFVKQCHSKNPYEKTNTLPKGHMRNRCQSRPGDYCLEEVSFVHILRLPPKPKYFGISGSWSFSFFPWYADTGTHPCQSLTTICSHVLLVSVDYTASTSLRQIPKFHLISFCGNFVERHSLRRGLGNLPETLRKLCLSTKFLHQVLVFDAVCITSFDQGHTFVYYDKSRNTVRLHETIVHPIQKGSQLAQFVGFVCRTNLVVIQIKIR